MSGLKNGFVGTKRVIFSLLKVAATFAITEGTSTIDGKGFTVTLKSDVSGTKVFIRCRAGELSVKSWTFDFSDRLIEGVVGYDSVVSFLNS